MIPDPQTTPIGILLLNPMPRLPAHLQSEPWSTLLWEDVLHYVDLLEEMDQGLSDNDVVIDVGGNIGFAAVLFHLHYNATVFSIEAIPNTFAALQKNCAPYRNITPLHTAVGAQKEENCLLEYPLARGLGGLNQSRISIWTALISEYLRGVSDRTAMRSLLTLVGLPFWILFALLIVVTRRSVRISQTTISALLQQHYPTGAIALLKIDIEGHEAEALRGLEPTDWARIDRIIVEVHPENRSTVQTMLQQHNFEIQLDRPSVLNSDTAPRLLLAQRKAQGCA